MRTVFPNSEYSLVSFYGFAVGDNTLSLYHSIALEWFERLGVVPSKMASAMGTKIGDFNRMNKKVIADGFSLKKTRCLQIYSEPSDGLDAGLGCSLKFSISTGSQIYCSAILGSSLLR